jgi:hypothetical protein
MTPNHWLYMISYKFAKGSGRTFLTRTGAPIDSAEAVEEVEAEIRGNNPNLGPLHADNIVLLKEWSE